MFEKVIEFAESGNGRRLLNLLNKKDNVLSPSELDEVLRVYCEVGLPKEVESLKTRRRGLLRDDQYEALAEEIKSNCSSGRYNDFAASLKTLLSCGRTMNPTKTNVEGLF